MENYSDGDTFNRGRVDFTVTMDPDTDSDAPWDNSDGHGPVSDWTTRDKLPGEMVLVTDRCSKRYYDFAAAVALARKDGWGYLPGQMTYDRFAHSGKRKFRAYVRNGAAELTAYGKDANAAVSGLYTLHRASMTAKAYAAAAALADFNFLRSWCEGTWQYVGITVTDESNGDYESLWGVADGDPEYVTEVVHDLADELLYRRKALRAEAAT